MRLKYSIEETQLNQALITLRNWNPEKKDVYKFKPVYLKAIEISNRLRIYKVTDEIEAYRRYFNLSVNLNNHKYILEDEINMLIKSLNPNDKNRVIASDNFGNCLLYMDINEKGYSMRKGFAIRNAVEVWKSLFNRNIQENQNKR